MGTRAIESVFIIIKCQHLLLQALFPKGRCMCHGLHVYKCQHLMLQALLAEGRSMCHGLCTSVSAYCCKPSLQKVGLCIMVYVQVSLLTILQTLLAESTSLLSHCLLLQTLLAESRSVHHGLCTSTST